MDEQLAYLLGAAGDACISHRLKKGEYCVEYEQKNSAWLMNSICPRILSCFGKRLPMHRRKSGLFRVRLYSKRAYGMFKPVWLNPDCVLEWPAASQREYVRGFFDAEGSVPKRLPGKGWRLSIYQKDRRKLNVISDILKRNGVMPGRLTNSRDIGLLPIREKSNVERFASIFAPEHPDKKEALKSLFS